MTTASLHSFPCVHNCSKNKIKQFKKPHSSFVQSFKQTNKFSYYPNKMIITSVKFARAWQKPFWYLIFSLSLHSSVSTVSASAVIVFGMVAFGRKLNFILTLHSALRLFCRYWNARSVKLNPMHFWLWNKFAPSDELGVNPRLSGENFFTFILFLHLNIHCLLLLFRMQNHFL